MLDSFRAFEMMQRKDGNRECIHDVLETMPSATMTIETRWWMEPGKGKYSCMLH